MKRRDVVRIAQSDNAYGRCDTCRHYQHLMVCEECYNSSRYVFDWREYAKFLINDVNQQLGEAI